MNRTVLVLAALFLTNCVPTPESYSVPPQHASVTAPEPIAFLEMLEAGDPRIEGFFVADIKGIEGGAWRWTGPDPQVRLQIRGVKARELLVEFSVNPLTFKDTGPLRMNFQVNGKLLGSETYKSPGDKVFKKRVPPEWVNIDADNYILVQIENPWTAPADGVKLGVLLHRIGFVS